MLSITLVIVPDCFQIECHYQVTDKDGERAKFHINITK